jgi:pyrroloquinoline-quinone synthase
MTKALMAQPEFYKALESARTVVHSGGHPFSVAWANGELSLKQIGEWAVQHFYYIDAIPQQFAQFFCRLDDLEARQHMLENLLGEEMPDTPDKRHPNLLVKFGKACGMTHARHAVLDLGTCQCASPRGRRSRYHGRSRRPAANLVPKIR